MKPSFCYGMIGLAIWMSIGCQTTQPKLEWICYYGHQVNLSAFSATKLVVLDPATRLEWKPLLNEKRQILGYLSLGEANLNQPAVQALPDRSFLGEANPNWPGAYFVDLRSPIWQTFILDQRIPEIFNQGFNGLFFDTLDSAVALEQKAPQHYQGMKQAAISLLREIRRRYPQAYLMVNRGIEWAEGYAPYVNAILAESLMTDYDFSRKAYRLRSPQEAEGYFSLLQQARQQHGVMLYSLDYWNPSDRTTIQQIYREQSKRGFIPYVATIQLDEIIPRP